MLLGRTILSLCDQTGNWPRFYKEAGYPVIQVDLKLGMDVRLMPRPDVPIHGILAAPPCTIFSRAGNRWPRTAEQLHEALALVDACLRFVAICRPTWWALENPVGKLKRYLGQPAYYFDPCDFGDPYTKRTALWGHFTPPVKNRVEPTQGSKIHLLPGVLPSDTEEAKNKKRMARSATPLGFAKAFFEANP